MTSSKTIGQSLAAAALAATLSGCFNASSYTPILESATSLDPAERAASGAIATGTTKVLVFGSFLSSDTVVYWNGRRQPTTLLTAGPGANSNSGDGGELQVGLDPAATKIAGTVDLTAMGEGTLMSKPLHLNVVDAVFDLIVAAPLQVSLGAPDTTLTFTGTGFNPSARVSWEGTALQTTFVSSTNVTALVPASLLTAAGTQRVKLSERSCHFGPSCGLAEATVLANVGSDSLKVVQTVGLGALDMVWDKTHALLYANMVPQPPFQARTASIAAIDPATAAIGGTVPILDDAHSLSISDGGQFLYVGGSAPVRLTLPGLTAAMSFAGLVAVPHVLVAAPGTPDTVAIREDLLGSDLSIVDGTVVRANIVRNDQLGSFTWGADASIIYAISPSVPGVHVFNVDASGVTKGPVLGTTQFLPDATITFDRTTRRIYANSGENLDEHGDDPRPFPLGRPGFSNSCKAAFDSVLGKAFFACGEESIGLTIRSFDLRTQQPLGRFVVIPPNLFGAPDATSLVRSGDGLAISGFQAGIYLYSGDLVR